MTTTTGVKSEQPLLPRPPMLHDLKCWPAFFKAMRTGHKTFDVRFADRDYRVGDVLQLREWDPETGVYVDKSNPGLFRRITYILCGSQWGLRESFVVLGLRAEVAMHVLEREHIALTMEYAADLQSVAKIISIDKATLYRKRKIYGLK